MSEANIVDLYFSYFIPIQSEMHEATLEEKKRIAYERTVAALVKQDTPVATAHDACLAAGISELGHVASHG